MASQSSGTEERTEQGFFADAIDTRTAKCVAAIRGPFGTAAASGAKPRRSECSGERHAPPASASRSPSRGPSEPDSSAGERTASVKPCAIRQRGSPVESFGEHATPPLRRRTPGSPSDADVGAEHIEVLYAAIGAAIGAQPKFESADRECACALSTASRTDAAPVGTGQQ